MSAGIMLDKIDMHAFEIFNQFIGILVLQSIAIGITLGVRYEVFVESVFPFQLLQTGL